MNQTLTDLETLLRQSDRSTMISFVAVTDPDMRRRGNPFCRKHGRRIEPCVRKVSSLGGALIGCSYTRIVDNRRRAQGLPVGTSKLKTGRPRAWGQHVGDSPLIELRSGDTCRLYLQVIVRNRNDAFFDKRTGEEIDRQAVAEWLAERDRGYQHQQLQNPVIVKDFALSSIARLRFRGTEYTIAPLIDELHQYVPERRPRRLRA